MELNDDKISELIFEVDLLIILDKLNIDNTIKL